MIRAIATLLLLAGFLAACSGASRYAELAKGIPLLRGDQARLTFFRESAAVGFVASTRVRIDGQTVGKLDNGTAFYVDRPPGAIAVTVDYPYSPGKYTIPVKTEAGREYFFRVSNRTSNILAGAFLGFGGQYLESAAQGERGGGYQVELVSRDDAVREIGDLALKSPN
jgi:hypothetical protein